VSGGVASELTRVSEGFPMVARTGLRTRASADGRDRGGGAGLGAAAAGRGSECSRGYPANPVIDAKPYEHVAGLAGVFHWRSAAGTASGWTAGARARWLDRVQTVRLFAYRLPADRFAPIGEPEPHAHITTAIVRPLGPPEPVGNLLALPEAVRNPAPGPPGAPAVLGRGDRQHPRFQRYSAAQRRLRPSRLSRSGCA
jgi:hypothetical protein